MKSWNAFWFATTPRHSAGFFRILLCAWFLADFLAFLPGLDGAAPRDGRFMQPCAGSAWVAALHVPLEAARAGAWVLAPLALLGIGTRPSLFLLAVANFLLRAWHSSWVYVGHAGILPSLALFILAVAPGARAWSVDALLETWRRRRRGDPVAWLDGLAGPPAAVWPVHLILACCAVLYFSAGVAKLRWAGPDWLSGRTLQWYLQGRAGQKRLGDSTQFFVANRATPPERRFRDPWGLERLANSTQSTAAGRAVGASRALCAALACAALAIELGFPLLFFIPRAWQYALLAAAAALHAGIGALMAIDFGGWALMFLVAVDWNGVLRGAGRLLPGIGPGRCGS